MLAVASGTVRYLSLDLRHRIIDAPKFLSKMVIGSFCSSAPTAGPQQRPRSSKQSIRKTKFKVKKRCLQ